MFRRKKWSQLVWVLLASTSGLMASMRVARADVPMFFFVALARVTYWWAVPVAIAIEAIVLRFALKINWRRAFVASISINAASGVVGIPLYPVMGMMLYPILMPLVTRIFGFGAIVEATATFAVLVILDTSIEFFTLALLRPVFRIATNARTALWLTVANTLSTCLLVVVIALVPNLPSVNFGGRRPEMLTNAEMERVAVRYEKELHFMHRLGSALFKGKGLSEHRLMPEWVQAKREEASAMNFSELAIVIRAGAEKKDVTTTFLVGRADTRDMSLWFYGRHNDASGCLSSALACFVRPPPMNGGETYRAMVSYSTVKYSIYIVAVFAAPH